MNDFTHFSVCQREHRDTYDDCVRRVTKLLDDTPRKATLWMVEENPLLGGVSPVSMIANGKAERLAKYITEAEDIRDGSAEEHT